LTVAVKLPLASRAEISSPAFTTVTFDEKDGRTTLTHHTLFASAAMKNEYVGMGFVQGVGSGFDQLAGVVAAMKAG